MTAKMSRLFAQDPPQRPIKTLDDIVDDWIARFGANGKSKHMRDEVEEHCAQAPDWSLAIWRACLSLRPNGKLHNHQSRVPQKVRMNFAEIILNHKKVRTTHSFDDLYDMLNSIKPFGIGPVTLYDVAVRLAAYLHLEVKSLYLHAGVRIGYCLVTGQQVWQPSGDVLRISREKLPVELQRVPTNEVEDLLCTYRDVFSQKKIRARGYEESCS